MKRVAFQQAAQGQKPPLPRAVFLHRLQGVGRAGGDKAAAGGTGRGDVFAVAPDEGQKQALHLRSLFSQQAQPVRQGEQAALDLPVAAVPRLHPGHHHQVVAGEELVLVEAVGLPNAAAGAVAHHRLAQLHPHGEAQTAVAQVVPAAVQGQARVHRALAPAVQAAEHVIEFQRNRVLHVSRPLFLRMLRRGGGKSSPAPLKCPIPFL